MTKLSEEYGQVELVHHPLAWVRGLPGAQVGELVRFANGTCGQVFSLSAETVEILVFGSQSLRVGETVTRTGQPFSITLSETVIGATITPLGELGSIPKTERRGAVAQSTALSIDRAPKPLTERRRITQQLNTGVSVVDLILPLGKGQRELLVGDRKIGKTSFALQLAELQVHDGSLVVYAAIGKLQSEIKRLQQTFAEKGIADSVTIVAAAADDPPTVIYQTPFTAMTVAEYLNSLGHDVVLILDDLTTHARYYREIALVGKRFPGRDSYPGDIFFTHARLLERAGCFAHPAHPQTGIALSCFPLAETTDSELTDYIVSNLISITDGHLLFDTTLYVQGHRPAIHPGLSVSRVGKQTQTAVQRDMAHTLTSFINQYQKTVNLTHFGAELNTETKAILTRGEALFAFLNQTKDKTFSQSVILVMSGAILLDWFAGVAPKEIQAARDKLQERYLRNSTLKNKLDTLLTKTTSISDLLPVLTRERAALTALWQPSKT